tara:strand:- start:47 stop:487 length:441 start_codon:yes stop_codon:yes gene_type:complete
MVILLPILTREIPMKTIVPQGHVEWLEQQIETCTSIINNQMNRKVALTEALENAKGNSGSAKIVEVPTAKAKARAVSKLTKAERKIWRLLRNTDLSSAELVQRTKLKLGTVHSTIWSLRRKLNGSTIELVDGRYRIVNQFPQAVGT